MIPRTIRTLLTSSVAVLIFTVLTGCSSGDEFFETSSTDGRIDVQFILADGSPLYKVLFDDEVVIDSSGLGFILKDAPPLMHNFVLDGVKLQSGHERWEPVWGDTERVGIRYNGMEVTLTEKAPPSRILILEFRVFNDGLGFRYRFPEQDGFVDLNILSEETQFNFAKDAQAWWIPADYDSYEHLYRNTKLSEIDSVNTPITCKVHDSLYFSIHEANLTDYAGMTLKKVSSDPLVLESNLVPWPDGIKVKATLPHESPWRTIHIADKAGGLIESHLVMKLNEPSAIEDESWIRPMKYVGIWWGMHIGKYTWKAGPKHGATTENTKRYIDFAFENGIPGVLVEGWNTGWESWSGGDNFDFITPYDDFDLEEVTTYANEKGIYLIGHHETGGNIPPYEKYIDAAFALYESLGIRAVKTGYAGKIRPEGYHHHGQWMVNHYREVVKKAAEHKIMIDAHEPIKPTGISRTYPNMMTREGVRGMEYNAWSEGNPPEHTTILPFTRALAGPIDYTPGIFDLFFNDYRPERRVHSTLANQLALYVVLYSPLQMVADLPENYKNHDAFNFIKDVPCNWDQTKILNGEIGDYITVARKKNSNWYIGSITDEQAREITIKLDFLQKERNYQAVIYADGADANWESNPLSYEIIRNLVRKDDSLVLKLAAGGGQAIVLSTSE